MTVVLLPLDFTFCLLFQNWVGVPGTTSGFIKWNKVLARRSQLEKVGEALRSFFALLCLLRIPFIHIEPTPTTTQHSTVSVLVSKGKSVKRNREPYGSAFCIGDKYLRKRQKVLAISAQAKCTDLAWVRKFCCFLGQTWAKCNLLPLNVKPLSSSHFDLNSASHNGNRNIIRNLRRFLLADIDTKFLFVCNAKEGKGFMTMIIINEKVCRIFIFCKFLLKLSVLKKTNLIFARILFTYVKEK